MPPEIAVTRRRPYKFPGALEEERSEIVRRIHARHVESQFHYIRRGYVSEG